MNFTKGKQSQEKRFILGFIDIRIDTDNQERAKVGLLMSVYNMKFKS